MFLHQACPVCDGPSLPLDVVDFNKSCEELHGKYLPIVGFPVYYALCSECGFCFAPEFSEWTLEDFASKIYNSDYAQVDPDYDNARPRQNAKNLTEWLGDYGQGIRHVDYGGGNGLLSQLLRDLGWRSISYDPFVHGQLRPKELGQFELVTAFEVFEHVPDVQKLASELSSLLAEDGIILFSTLLSDGNLGPHQRLSWWYASPRNGHISLFSRDSLAILGAGHGLSFGSLSQSFHAYWKKIPAWASHLIGTNGES